MTTIAMISTLAAGLFWLGSGSLPDASGPETVEIPAGKIDFRPEGSFEREGRPATPAAETVQVPGFAIMVRQVSRRDFAACVAAGACRPTDAMGLDDAPQTDLNWYDAQDYAAYLSARTGHDWRLPSDREWQRAAAEAYAEGAVPDDAGDPGQRMLQRYETGLSLRRRAAASASVNGYGLEGISDLVWEWTDGCMATGRLDAAGRVVAAAPYCAARVVGGRHRAVVIDFVRDASRGGCAAGVPPDHLGMRLVRD